MQAVSPMPTHMALPTSAYFLDVKDAQLGRTALESLLLLFVFMTIQSCTLFRTRCYDDHLKLSTQQH